MMKTTNNKQQCGQFSQFSQNLLVGVSYILIILVAFPSIASSQNINNTISAYAADENDMLVASQFAGIPSTSLAVTPVAPASSPFAALLNANSPARQTPQTYQPCSVCNTGQVMNAATTILPVGTLPFVLIALPCIEVEKIAQRAEFNQKQCNTVRSSNLTTVCGCGPPPVRAPFTYRPTSPPVPTKRPHSWVPTKQPIVETSAPTGAPSIPPSEYPTTYEIPTETVSNKFVVSGRIKIQLQTVSGQMQTSTVPTFITVLDEFLNHQLNNPQDSSSSLSGSATVSTLSAVSSVNATFIKQELVHSTNERRRLGERRVLVSFSDLGTDSNSSTGINNAVTDPSIPMYPLDIYVDILGFVSMNSVLRDSSRLFTTEVIQVIVDQQQSLILSLQHTEGIIDPLFFRPVTRLTVSEVVMTPIDGNGIDSGSDSHVLTTGTIVLIVVIVLIGLLFIVAAVWVAYRLAKQKKQHQQQLPTGSVRGGSSLGSSKKKIGPKKDGSVAGKDSIVSAAPAPIVLDVGGGAVHNNATTPKPTSRLSQTFALFSKSAKNKKTAKNSDAVTSMLLQAAEADYLDNHSRNGSRRQNRRYGSSARRQVSPSPHQDSQHKKSTHRSSRRHRGEESDPNIIRSGTGVSENNTAPLSPSGDVSHDLSMSEESFSITQQLPFLGDGNDGGTNGQHDAMSYTFSLDGTGTDNRTYLAGGFVADYSAHTSNPSSTSDLDTTTEASVTNNGPNPTQPPQHNRSISLSNIVAASSGVTNLIKSAFAVGFSNNNNNNATPVQAEVSVADVASQDENNSTQEINQLFQSPDNMISRIVHAPAGKLGIVIDTTIEGPVVHRVFPSSPLEGKVFVGDIITAIDDVDTRAMSAVAISELMIKTAFQPRRLTVSSEDTLGIQRTK